MEIGKWEKCEGIEGLSLCVKKKYEFSFRLESKGNNIEDSTLQFLEILKETREQVEKTDTIESVTFEVIIKMKKEEAL